MADKRIEELPLLSKSDFNLTNDFIIVQQAGGGTYRIPASYLAVDSAFENVTDEQSVTLDYPISKASYEFPGGISFSYDDILTPESSFHFDVRLETLSHGSAVRCGKNYNCKIPLGLTTSLSVSKNKGLSVTSNGFSLGSVGSWQLMYHFHYGYPNLAISDLYMKHYMKFDFSNSNQILLKFMAVADDRNTENRHKYLPAQKVKYSSSLNASISS